MIPDGDLLRSRVVEDLAPALEDALERRLDGYAVLTARETLLGDTDDRSVITFENGVPTLAYHAGTDRGGPPALADTGSAPYRFELYALDATALEVPHTTTDLRVQPDMPAERLTDDAALAERTRELASTEHVDGRDALETFLDNEEAVADIQTSAREEAKRRAEEWGFEDAT